MFKTKQIRNEIFLLILVDEITLDLKKIKKTRISTLLDLKA